MSSPRGGPRQNSEGASRSPHLGSDEVENPNAFGPFGHHYEAPSAMEIEEYEHEEVAHGYYHHQQPHQRSDGSSPHQQQQQQQHAAQHSQRSWDIVQQQTHRHLDEEPQASPYSQHEILAHSHAASGAPHGSLDGQDVYIRPTASQSQLGLQHDSRSQISHDGSQKTHQRHGSGGDAFELVHNAKGGGGHLHQYGAEIPIHWRHLFKRPVIRQWVLQDKLYREVDEREPSQYELFWDLVIVSAVHRLGEGASEAATGLNVLKFLLLFYPIWSVWTDVRSYINVSGTDDVLQRFYLLINMILLVGYTANASAIVIHKKHAEAVIDPFAAPTSTTAAVHGRALPDLANMAMSIFAKRGEHLASTEEVVLVRQIGHTGFWFAEGWHAAVASAIGFYLVAKLCRLLLYFLYGLLLPKFRKALWANMISLIVISLIYLPVMFITRPGYIVLLIGFGLVVELSSRYIVAGVMQYLHGYAKQKGRKTYMPAYSLPHLMERMTQFTLLVVGESIMNATYQAAAGEYGPQRMFGRACFSIVIPFMLIWLYFDNDSSRVFVHGLKRHWFASITFTHLHFPLCAGLVLMSSAMTQLIKEEAVDVRFLWYFSGSVSLVMICIGLIGLVHKSLDRWGSSMVPRPVRVGVRFVFAALFVSMPTLHTWTSLQFLGAHAALLTLAVLFETIGKLGSVGRRYDPIRAEELRIRRKQSKGESEEESFAMSDIKPASEKSHMRNISASANNMLQTAARKFNKDGLIKGPGRRASWHEYDDLTGPERGEEDVGVESELGKLEVREVTSGERWAYVAT